METEQIVTTVAVKQPTVGNKIGGWLDETLGEGKSAIIQTCCSPCMIIGAIILLFAGEFMWVRDQNNIELIKKDMVDGVTGYSASNDGKPIAFYAKFDIIKADDVIDPQFGVTIKSAMKAKRKAYMLTGSVVKETSTSSDGKTQTTTKSCRQSWTSTIIPGGGSYNPCAPSDPYKYNDVDFKSPCPTGSSSCGKTMEGKVMADEFTVTEALIDDYTFRETSTVINEEEWGEDYKSKTVNLALNNTWFLCGGGTYLSNNYREDLGMQHGTASNPVCSNQQTPINDNGKYDVNKAIGYDHSVSWVAWKIPTAGFTICSKQTSGKTFEPLIDGYTYDLMLLGKKTKQDCIDHMTDVARAQAYIIRIMGFLMLWCGFCMMFALVSFFADRVGSLIPCGLGEMFSDCVDCMITVVTCPPAAACWLFWFSLAWLIFNPWPYGLAFLGSVIVMAGLVWWFKQNEGESAKEEPITVQDATNWNTQQAAPVGPPPPADDNGDANNDGIPDEYQDGLPPGWSAAMDHASGRIYWVDNNVSPAQSTWTDPRAPNEV